MSQKKVIHWRCGICQSGWDGEIDECPKCCAHKDLNERADEMVKSFNDAPVYSQVMQYDTDEYHTLEVAGWINGEVIARTAQSVWVGFGKEY